MSNKNEFLSGIWKLHNVERAFYAKKKGSSGGSLPLYIPVLMPNISMGNAKSFAMPVNSSCYCNASDCKPAVRNSIKQQNFITVPSTSNRNFEYGYFRLGDLIQVEFNNNNIDSAKVSTKIDNSRKKP